MKSGEREPFYKDKFCRAVTGYTDSELHDIMLKTRVDPANRIYQSLGSDMPRREAERMVDRFEIFMCTSFQGPLLNIPRESLCDAFRRFREWEELNHPKDRHPNQRKYWGPTYRKIEIACKERNEEAVRVGIIELVDKILHD